MKKVLPEPYSPITKRIAAPPSPMRSMSRTISSISLARPTCRWRRPSFGTTPARSACTIASRSRGFKFDISCLHSWASGQLCHDGGVHRVAVIQIKQRRIVFCVGPFVNRLDRAFGQQGVAGGKGGNRAFAPSRRGNHIADKGGQPWIKPAQKLRHKGGICGLSFGLSAENLAKQQCGPRGICFDGGDACGVEADTIAGGGDRLTGNRWAGCADRYRFICDGGGQCSPHSSLLLGRQSRDPATQKRHIRWDGKHPAKVRAKQTALVG